MPGTARASISARPAWASTSFARRSRRRKLAYPPGESRQDHGFDRLLYRADPSVSGPMIGAVLERCAGIDVGKKTQAIGASRSAGTKSGHLAFLEDQIAQLDEQIFSHIERCGFHRAHALLQTIPGIKKQAAAAILAEVGMDMGVFGSGPRCSSWAGACPGNNESAGKRKRAPVLRGNPWLRTTLIECAWGASNPIKPARSSGRDTRDWHRASVTNEQLLPWHIA